MAGVQGFLVRAFSAVHPPLRQLDSMDFCYPNQPTSKD